MKQVITLLIVLLQVHFAVAETLVKPTQPAPRNCQDPDIMNSQTKFSECLAANKTDQENYIANLKNYNTLVQAQAVADKLAADQATAAAAAATQVANNKSALAEIKKAEEKMKKGAQTYKDAATVCTVTSMAFAAWFAISCLPTGATCNPWLLAASVGFGIGTVLANSQAEKYTQAAIKTCEIADKHSASIAGCASTTVGTGTNNTGGTVVGGVGGTSTVSPYDSNGNCIPGNESVCTQIQSNLPPGMNIRDAQAAIAQFSSGKKTLPYTVNPDGTATTKTGKKFKAEDFTNEKALVDAGLSPSQAALTVAAIKKNAAATDALANTKKDIASDSFGSSDLGGGADLSGGAIKVAEGTNNGAITGEGKDVNGSGVKGSGAREPASAEGLAKNFNGELIGVSGDNIFKMMNRRYNLKASQDSFIGP